MTESVSCPNCGAPLNLRNPDMARSAHCEQCGSQLNLTDMSVQAILSPESMSRHAPKSKLRLGLEGDFLDVKYMIIGRIRYRNTKSYDTWDEWLLLSENGQYLWLEEANWEFTLMHKFTPSEPLDPNQLQEGRRFLIDGYHLEVEEKSGARIEYFEGELTWGAKLNEYVNFLDAWQGEETVYSIEWNEKEIMYFLGKSTPVENVYEAFNLGEPPPESVQEYVPPESNFQIWTAKLINGPFYKLSLAIGILMCLTALFLAPLGKPVPNRALHNKNELNEILIGPYSLNKKGTVYRIDTVIKQMDQNAVVLLEYSILDEKKNPVTIFEYDYYLEPGSKEIIPSPTHGNKRTIWFVLQDPGEYSLKIVPKSTGVKWSGLEVVVKEGVFYTSSLWAIALIVLIYPGFVLFMWLIANSTVKEEED